MSCSFSQKRKVGSVHRREESAGMRLENEKSFPERDNRFQMASVDG